MARKGRKGGRRKQGVVSWLTSLIAILIGLAPVFRALNGWLFGGGSFAGAVSSLNQNYNPMAGNRPALIEGYGSLVGGLVFKVATSELAKRAKIKSLVPAMHA